MATFFGEVLPVSSRAVDDDDDDEDQTFSFCEPIIHWSKRMRQEKEKAEGQKIPCSNLVIAVGMEASAFTEIYVKQFTYEVIGGIFTSVQDDDVFTVSQTSPTDKTCYIHRCHSNPSILVIQCNRDIPVDQSFAWTKLIYDCIELSDAYIAVLTANSTGNFCSDVPSSDLDTPFLRALKSEKFLGTPICKILEQPNMLTGLAAQLMTFFQAYHNRAVVYICFKESRYMEIADVKSFLPTLGVTPIKDITEPNKNAEQMLKDIIELHSNHDTLYM